MRLATWNGPMPEKQNFCVNCAFYYEPTSRCHRTRRFETCPVTGKQVPVGERFVYAERRLYFGVRWPNTCGPNGLFWKRKEPA